MIKAEARISYLRVKVQTMLAYNTQGQLLCPSNTHRVARKNRL